MKNVTKQPDSSLSRVLQYKCVHPCINLLVVSCIYYVVFPGHLFQFLKRLFKQVCYSFTYETELLSLRCSSDCRLGLHIESKNWRVYQDLCPPTWGLKPRWSSKHCVCLTSSDRYAAIAMFQYDHTKFWCLEWGSLTSLLISAQLIDPSVSFSPSFLTP